MQLARPVIASHPHLFGRGPIRELAAPAIPSPVVSDDLKLFASTFVVGFLFVSVLIG
jgi:hypothetical protein